jgi:repressor LexA
MTGKYTQRQGEYLAFIYYYTKIHGYAPSEADLEQHFKVAWSSVHQMILTLEKRRLISRIPGASRSIRVLLSREELPDLK